VSTPLGVQPSLRSSSFIGVFDSFVEMNALGVEAFWRAAPRMRRARLRAAAGVV